MKSLTYVLDVGEDDAQRLDLVDRIHGKKTRRFLSRFLSPDMAVLEVGCGTGNVSRWIAGQLSEEGRIVATDISSEQIAVAKSYPQHKSLSYSVISAYHLHEYYSNYDLIFARYVLHHLDSPQNALSAMSACLKPEGLLIIEEPDHGGWGSENDKTFIDMFRELLIKVGKKRHVDYCFGKVLIQVMQDLNLDIQYADSEQIETSLSSKKAMLSFMLDKIGNEILAGKWLDIGELNVLKENIEHFITGDFSLRFPKMTLVCARRAHLDNC